MTYYYKQFVISGTPRYPGHRVEFNELRCFIGLDVHPTDESSFQDSTYRFSLAMIRKDSELCTEANKDMFSSVELTVLTLSIPGTTFEMHDLYPLERTEPAPCIVVYRFAPVTISDTVDAVTIGVTLSYVMNGTRSVEDTTVSLFRLTGKGRELVGD